MALLTRASVREYGRRKTGNFLTKSAASVLQENVRVAAKASAQTFDIFLSHRFADKEELAGLLEILQDGGHSVLVDWEEHPELDRSKVTRKTAAALKADMRRCTTLLFAITSTSSSSLWMPWELGLFDGMNGRVATVPLSSGSSDKPGQEYVELYPWVDEAPMGNSTKGILWVNEADDTYVSLKDWINGATPIKRTKAING